MSVLVAGDHVTFQMDGPSFDGLDGETELLGVEVLLVVGFSAIFQLDGFHAFEEVSVGVADGAVWPASRNVVKEEACHVGWLLVVLTLPFASVVQGQPIGEFGTDFRVQSVSVHSVFAECNESVLVHETAADTIGEPVGAATN